VQLPSAAGFIDPLLSTGFPLTLLGIQRVAKAIEMDWGTEHFALRVQMLSGENEADFLAAEQLVAALYAQTHDFPIFRALSLLYFAAAGFTETARRLQRGELARGFLLHEHGSWTQEFGRICRRALTSIPSPERAAFISEIIQLIEPINVAGLGEIRRDHWYAAELEDLVTNASKLAASPEEVRGMIRKVLTAQSF
jgi:FADH2 O2-dependent halogenase